MSRDHLHLDDHPDTLAVLGALLASRQDNEELGYEPTEQGAWWETVVPFGDRDPPGQVHGRDFGAR